MRDELDASLVEKYPHMFKNRYGSMQETCMCWGFECGDGWYKILDILCANIESHVSWKRMMRATDLRRIRAYKKGRDALRSFLYRGKQEDELTLWQQEELDRIMEEGPRDPVEKVHRVVAEQVKEKFGTLRFYIQGGDEYVYGLIRMAEGMTAVTCEQCGSPAQTRHGGWVRTLCDTHEAEYQAKWAKMKDEDE